MAILLLAAFLVLTWNWKPFDKGLPVHDEDEWRRQMWKGKQ